MNNKPRRNFCFTIFDLECIPALSDKVRYVKWQHEKCPTSGKEHYQGWCQLSVSCRPTAIQKEWGCKFHYEECRGTEEDNEKYCSKSESRVAGPWELGAIVKQGKRTDIEKCLQDIQNGESAFDVLMANPNAYIKYTHGFKTAKSIIDAKDKSRRKVQVIVLWGESGCGKTTEAIMDSDDYYLLGHDAETLWWDGYDGEKTLIIDDFYGWIQYANFLRITEGWQYRMPVKGTHTYARWTKVYITSNVHPREWFDLGFTPAIERRTAIDNESYIKFMKNVTK